MRRAREKLKSTRGASLALALLLLLVCIAVGVSLLMAAASNGGRVRSNRQERQGYLALSSAMELVTQDLATSDPAAGDPAKMEYYGKYNYTPEKEEENAAGEVTVISAEYVQEGGTVEGGTELGEKLKPVFDWIFGQALKAQADAERADCDLLSGGSIHDPKAPFKWTVKTGAVTGTSDPLEGFVVQAEITVQENYVITLTFTFAEVPDGYPEEIKDLTLRAQLTPQGGVPTPGIPKKDSTDPDATTSNESTKVSWKLDWVTDRKEDSP